jgi:hypothetical protein
MHERHRSKRCRRTRLLCSSSGYPALDVFSCPPPRVGQDRKECGAPPLRHDLSLAAPRSLGADWIGAGERALRKGRMTGCLSRPCDRLHVRSPVGPCRRTFLTSFLPRSSARCRNEHESRRIAFSPFDPRPTRWSTRAARHGARLSYATYYYVRQFAIQERSARFAELSSRILDAGCTRH